MEKRLDTDKQSERKYSAFSIDGNVPYVAEMAQAS